MDIHRCRFVPYQPSAINAVAFSHPYTKSAKHASFARLAIGRANGDIEIWNPVNGAWHQELVIRGGKDRSVDGLVWVNEPDQDLGQGRVLYGRSRLFSIGYTSTVTEWDLETGKPKRHASGQHGDIWCIAAQPQGTDHQADGAVTQSQSSNTLVAGTIDGELVLYSIEDNDLRFDRVRVRSPTKKAQMVSITFQSRKVVIVGCSDSTVRAYDIVTGQTLRRMTLGADLHGGSKDIIVWSVKCLPGGNIVSGDSTGHICIWDAKTYTQVQKMQSHKQDVLSLTVSADGQAIMSGGMDRRTVYYKPNASGSKRWAKVWGRRYHDHDVKAMATFEHGRTSVVVTGGPDSNLVIVPLKEMGRENHRTLGNLPQQPSIMSASQARFLVSWWDREVHIWVLRKPASEIYDNATGEDFDINQNRKLLKTIVVKGDSNIASATINQEGKLLIVSTATDVKAFRLEHEDPAQPSDIKLSSITLPEKISKLGASVARLSPNGCWLLLVQEGSKVLMSKVQLSQQDEGSASLDLVPQRLKRLRRNVPRYVLNGGLGAYDRNITHVDFSADSKMVATADLAGYIDTWVLGQDAAGSGEQDADEASSSSDSDSSEDGNGASVDTSEQWSRNRAGRLLPKLPASPAVLSFSGHTPSGQGQGGKENSEHDDADDYNLLAITSLWQPFIFNPRRGALTSWSRRHSKDNLPTPVQDLLDIPKGVFWQGPRVWAYGTSFLLMLDTSQDQPKPAARSALTGAQKGKQGTKRKRNGARTGAGGKMKEGNLQPHRVHKHGADGHNEDVDMDDATAAQADDSNSDDEMYDGVGGELSELRNREPEEGSTEVAEAGTQRKSWWITYKYRPIFGIVQLGSSSSSSSSAAASAEEVDEEGGQQQQQLEVAVVERPLFDVDLPERYYASEPWREN